MPEPIRLTYSFLTKRSNLSPTIPWLGPRGAWGGDLMRFQSIKAAQPHLPTTVSVSFGNLILYRGGFLNFDRWLKAQNNAVVVLSNSLSRLMTDEHLERLRVRARAVGVDYKDDDLSQYDLSRFDFHVAISHAGKRALDTLLAKPTAENGSGFAEILLQPPDDRLAALPAAQNDRFSAVYVGSPQNSLIPPDLKDSITTLRVVYGKDMHVAIPHLPRHNLHYAVRAVGGEALARVYKPFVKGYTAAACGANVIVNRDVDDVLDLLPSDYPYLVDSMDESAVAEVFRRAKEDFGGPDWIRAREMAASMLQEVTPEAIGEQIDKIARQAADHRAR